MTADRPVRLKQFGARRTGTNYLKALLELNFDDVDVAMHEGGWKHGVERPDELDPDGYLIVAKDPYAWILSVEEHFRPYHVQKVWDALTRAFKPFLSFRQTRAMTLETYLMKYAYWLELTQDRPHLLVRYEDLLEDLDETLDGIREAFDLTPPGDGYRDIERRVKPADEEDEVNLDGGFDPTYYTEKRYLDAYRDDELDRIARHLRERDFEPLVERLGYRIVDP